MAKRTADRILSVFLSFFIVFFLTFPVSNLAFAENQENPTLTLDPSGQPVPAVPVSGEVPQEKTAVQESSVSSSSTTDFLSGRGPLSHVDEEEQVLLESNDPFYSSAGSWGQSYDDLWWLKRVRADQAWSYTRGTGATVAVIDTGLDYTHPDIAGALWSNPSEASGLPGVDDDHNGFVDDVNGWDFYNWDNDPRDDQGHGTHVAGIIGARADNGIGIAGVAPESKIIPIKVLNSKGSGFVSDVIDAIYYAANLGAQVINMSLGVLKSFLSKTLRSAFEKAVAYAKAKGTVVVAAAGNDNSRVENSYPAGIRDVVAVGAIEPVTDQRAWFSNFGKLLDLVAPGVDVLSLKASGVSFGLSSVVDPNYVRASGTSMASPVVAGVAALLRARNASLTYDQVVSILRSSAVDLGTASFDSFYGYGLVDALGAVTMAASVASVSQSESSGSSGSSKKDGKAGQASLKEIGAPSEIPIPVSEPVRLSPSVRAPLSWYTGAIGSSARFTEAFRARQKDKRPGSYLSFLRTL